MKVILLVSFLALFIASNQVIASNMDILKVNSLSKELCTCIYVNKDTETNCKNNNINDLNKDKSLKIMIGKNQKMVEVQINDHISCYQIGAEERFGCQKCE